MGIRSPKRRDSGREVDPEKVVVGKRETGPNERKGTRYVIPMESVVWDPQSLCLSDFGDTSRWRDPGRMGLI